MRMLNGDMNRAQESDEPANHEPDRRERMQVPVHETGIRVLSHATAVQRRLQNERHQCPNQDADKRDHPPTLRVIAGSHYEKHHYRSQGSHTSEDANET